MLFRKEKGMVDVRELQKRGVVRIPKDDIVIPTNKEGFVEFGKQSSSNGSSSNAEFFGFMGSSPKPTSSTNSFSTQGEGYNKREVDEKVTELDNKIYKLENRIELLERKLNISQNSGNQDSSVGVMGW